MDMNFVSAMISSDLVIQLLINRTLNLTQSSTILRTYVQQLNINTQ